MNTLLATRLLARTGLTLDTANSNPQYQPHTRLGKAVRATPINVAHNDAYFVEDRANKIKSPAIEQEAIQPKPANNIFKETPSIEIQRSPELADSDPFTPEGQYKVLQHILSLLEEDLFLNRNDPYSDDPLSISTSTIHGPKHTEKSEEILGTLQTLQWARNFYLAKGAFWLGITPTLVLLGAPSSTSNLFPFCVPFIGFSAWMYQQYARPIKNLELEMNSEIRSSTQIDLAVYNDLETALKLKASLRLEQVIFTRVYKLLVSSMKVDRDKIDEFFNRNSESSNVLHQASKSEFLTENSTRNALRKIDQYLLKSLQLVNDILEYEKSLGYRNKINPEGELSLL